MPIHSRLGKKMEIEIERLGINGEGVGHWYGCTVFVDFALPGEKVTASLYEKKKTYARAYVVDFHTKSSARQEPICPLFGRCGGCQIMHLRYEDQLVAKRQRVVDALERIGKFTALAVERCIPSPSALYYRNKIQIPILPSPSGGLRFGLYARQSHDLVDMERCYIHCAMGQKIFEGVRTILSASQLKGYDRQSKTGELRHLLIKSALATKEALVVLISATPPDKVMSTIAEKILDTIPEVRGVVHCLNDGDDNVVMGEIYTTLAGEGSIIDEILGMRFLVSPASFFQVNPGQAENVYRAVARLAGLNSEDVVLDAYCGVGTISCILAKTAAKVFGVEYVAKAIEDARFNAKLSGLTNTEFFAAPVEDYIKELSSNVSVIVLNPPRKGCDPAVIEACAHSLAKKIIYVSCDPASLARDLRSLEDKGWHIDAVEPFDMFPQTSHVETVVSLSRISFA